MNRSASIAALSLAVAAICSGARCTTVMNETVLREYESYLSAVAPARAAKFEAGELTWLPDAERARSVADLAAGRTVRRNITDPALNQRLAGRNGTIIDWIGAVLIRGAHLRDVAAVIQDYGRYAAVYRPMIYECRAERVGANVFDVTVGLENTYRFASVFPQRYSFRAKTRIEYSHGSPSLLVHLRSGEIRESDSGVPGRNDFLEPYHDHGILWALNTWWRARQSGGDVYLEFQSITLARSVSSFVCRIGGVPVPKSLISGVMEKLPAESVELMLAATKAECERRSHR